MNDVHCLYEETINSYTEGFSMCSLGLRELPYWSNYSRPRLFIHTVTMSKYFDLSIAGIIGLNVITMALEYYLMPRASTFPINTSVSVLGTRCRGR